MENQMEKKMENEMETGMCEKRWVRWEADRVVNPEQS